MNPVTILAVQNIHPKWKVLLNLPLKSGKTLIEILDKTLKDIVDLKVKLCPDTPDKILRCLQLDPDLTKVVLIGQDPYPQPGIATGLAFACEGLFQPSLNVIYKSLQEEFQEPDLGFEGNLLQWESQGILLLNSSLSCEQFKSGSHSKYWEEFIAGLLEILNDFKLSRKAMTSLVFVFLGKQAQMFESEVSSVLHYKMMRYHPVAETYGKNKFVGFYKEVNKYLVESGQDEIKWI